MTRSPAERENARNLLDGLAEEHIERAVEAIWSGRQLCRAVIESSDDIAAEAVAKAEVSRLLRAWVLGAFDQAEPIRIVDAPAWRGLQGVAAPIRYAHELRGRR